MNQTSDQVMPDKAPEKARELLNDADPGPWGVEYDRDWAIGISAPEGIVFGPYYDQEEMDQWETGSDANLRLAAAAPTLATIVAGMRPEYRTEEWQGSYPGWVPTSPWAAEKPVGDPGPNTRIVRRYVTEQEEIQ